MILCFYHTEKL